MKMGEKTKYLDVEANFLILNVSRKKKIKGGLKTNALILYLVLLSTFHLCLNLECISCLGV